MSTSCLFCDTLAAAGPPPGGWVLRDELVTAWIHPGAEYPGWYVLQLNRHCDGYVEMTRDDFTLLAMSFMTIREICAGISADRSRAGAGVLAMWQCTHSMGSEAANGRLPVNIS